MSTGNGPPAVSFKDFAGEIGRSVETIYEYERLGLPTYRPPGKIRRDRYVHRDEAHAWVVAHRATDKRRRGQRLAAEEAPFVIF